MFCTFSLPNVLFATAACIFSTSARTKVVQTRHVLKILTSKCAFRHSRVHFFNISTYKSGPNTSCFVHFHFRMCFSPQRRAIFRHLNFEKCSRTLSFLTFSLPNVLFATAACNFWFIRWPPDSAPAALTGLLFDWPDTRIIEKTQHFVTSLTFSADVSSFTWLWHYCIFCRLTWRLYCWAMHLLFNSPYCRKFLFKLPSTNLSVEFISFGCPPVFGGRGGVPKRTHVALEDDVVWDWVILAENWSWHGSLSREQRRQLVTPLLTFHVSLIHKKFLHFFAGILKKTKQDMYGSSNPKGYHWKNKVSTPALWIVWTTLIKKGHKGDKYIWNDLELPIQLSLSHEKKNILSIILVV